MSDPVPYSDRKSMSEFIGPNETAWTTDEATAAFKFEAFSAPFATVVRKSDGKRGTLHFGDFAEGRRYYDFVESSQ